MIYIMNPKYKDTRILDVAGILDEDCSGKYIINIETKDNTLTKDFDEILKNSLGEMVEFKVIMELDG